MRIFLWLLFAWSVLWLYGMLYFSISWFIDTENSLRHELLLGYSLSVFYALPSLALTLVITSIAKLRPKVSIKEIIVLNLPLILSLINFFILLFTDVKQWLF